jgi:hypothetical protein
MSTPYPAVVERARWGHPSVAGERARERLLLGMGVLIPLVLALAISVALPKPGVGSVLAVALITLGAAAVVALMVSTRYAVTLTLLTLYLGLLDGPVKLQAASKFGSGLRDLLIAAIVLGMLMRLGRKRERVALPPLSGWVVGFVAVVLVEALNPDTGNILKVVGGYRQDLEWVPFFFFGYMMMRSKHRFRQLFLVLGVIALANGVVGAYQSRLGPTQLASWGPGYASLAEGGAHLSARTYKVEGVGHVRPPALGSDAGFGGGVGTLALPCLLALLTVGRLRRRWPVLLCCVGALAGIATAASRTSVIIGVLVLVGFAGLSILAGLRVSRTIVGLLVAAVGIFTVGYALIELDGSSIFHRQETLTSSERAEETGGGAKATSLSRIPSDLIHDPFGVGLGTAGAVSGFGGAEHIEVEGEKAASGSAYSLLTREVGAPGLFLWVGLTLSVIALAVRRLRRIRDLELRTYLVALLTGFLALSIEGLTSPTLAVTVGAFLWFVPGVIAYWFAGAGRAAMRPSAASAL